MQFETGAAVEQAMDLFWRQGYAGTTPQELASAMGIGKGSLYNTFVSKHALFMSALRRYSERRLEYLTDLFSAPGPIGPRLKRAIAVLAGVGEHQRGCVMVNAVAELGAADDDVNRIASELFTQIEAVFRQAITQGQESGEFGVDRVADAAAGQVLASVIGLSVLIKAGRPSETFGAIVDGIIDAL
ncbi:TetR/AcrR family transcriptional regulator [Nocardia sp. CA-135953]|uniref:TetR/AcrR family transcriptional regulator n=1 Tax=Nocardia sp. CA-135953 TaxID=3239978 RepID=UPI003D98CFB4